VTAQQPAKDISHSQGGAAALGQRNIHPMLEWNDDTGKLPALRG
jgi:hypothetical protein